MARPAAARNKFSAALLVQLDTLGLTQKQLALHIGKSESQVSAYFASNEWPETEFQLICRFARMDVVGKTAAKEVYLVEFKRPYRTVSQMRMAATVAKLKPPQPKASAAPLVARLFGEARRGSFFGVSSQTIFPAPFRVVSEPDMADGLYTGMDNEALVGFFLPTADRILRLTDHYGFDEVPSLQRYLNGFAEFRDGYVERLRGAGHPAPEEAAGRRTQLFLCDEFPLTPCGHTVTLFGEAFGHGWYELEVLVRGPGSYGEIGLLPDNPTHCDRLRRWMSKVMEVDAQVNPAAAARGQFIHQFRRRMFGYLD